MCHFVSLHDENPSLDVVWRFSPSREYIDAYTVSIMTSCHILLPVTTVAAYIQD